MGEQKNMHDQKHMNPSERTDRIRRHRGHLILEAGAGTGKTHSLIERVIYQLTERKVPLERILALTFTDFAAAEMRTRVYQAINRCLREKNGNTEHLRNSRRRFSKNYISTFHSFCNRVLQYFPDELTGIRISDQPVFDHGSPAAAHKGTSGTERNKSDHQESATTRNYGEPVLKNVEGSFELLDDHDESIRMIDWRKIFYRKYREHSGLQRQLTRLSARDFESFMDKLGGLDEYVLYDLAGLSPEKYLEKLRYMIREWQREKEALESSLLSDFEKYPEWFRKPDQRPRTFDDMAGFRKKTDSKFKQQLFDTSGIDPEVLDDVNNRAQKMFFYADEQHKGNAYLDTPGLAERIRSYPDEDDFHPDHEAYWNMRDLSELALRWHALMRFQRFEEGYFNYDDMVWLTATLLRQNPSVVKQMRDRYDQILIDEFQDTDHRQWDIIRMLGFGKPGNGSAGKEADYDNEKPASATVKQPDSEITGKSEDKEILIVGDVKQAIYAFRGGDVVMMQRANDDLTGRPGLPPETVPLTHTFRSNSAITGFANRLFRKVFGTGSGSASYEANHQPLSLPPSGLSGQTDASGEVRLFRTDFKELRARREEWSVAAESLSGHMALLEARRIARFLRDIYDGKQPVYDRITKKMRDKETAVGILYRRRKYFYAMEQALEEAGISFTVAKGAGFYERREVHDTWLLLAFLLDAHDDVSLTGLLRSPFISLSDSGLLALRMVMDETGSDYPNFWSALTAYRSWYDEMLNRDDRLALEQGVPFLQELRQKVPFSRVSDLMEHAFFNEGPWFGAFAGDRQVTENLLKLLDLIRKLESSGRGTLFEITGFLSDRIEEQARDSEAEHPDPAPVQLMTIHGSKGLQFPMVVIPDMYAGMNDRGVRLNIADNDSESIAWPAFSYKTADQEADEDPEESFLNQVLKHENRKRNIAELKRLFYVAVTRAETHLLLSMSKPFRAGESGTFAELLKQWLVEQEEGNKIHWNTDTETGCEAGELIIEDLDQDELELLAENDYGATESPAPSDPVPPLIPDRTTGILWEAGREVSPGVVPASGLKPVIDSGTETRPVRDGHPDELLVPQWSAITPADAGTLIHRTLETGHESSQSSAIIFWQRELLKMGYTNVKTVERQNRVELWRHCCNAVEWMHKQFGARVSKRFEVAFELNEREDDKTVTIRGSIDLILKDRKGNEHIIDFKTGITESGQSAQDSNSGRKISGGHTSSGRNISGNDSSSGRKISDGHTSSGRKISGGHTSSGRTEKENIRSTDITTLQQQVKKFGYDRQISVYRRAGRRITGQDIPDSRIWLLFTYPDGGMAVNGEQIS